MATLHASKQSSKLVLYRGWPEQGVYYGSPFVIKLEARLRFSGLPYRTEAGPTSKGPNGKVPYVQLSADNPSLMGDSTLITRHLVNEGRLQDLNQSLSPASRTVDLAFAALMEDKLYFYTIRERWLDNYYIQRDTALSAVPYPIRVLLGLYISRSITQTLHGQGCGRFSAEEVSAFRREIWEAINSYLVEMNPPATRRQGKKPFWLLGGEKPSEADAVLYGFILSPLTSQSAPESRKVVKSFPVLIDYAERIHDHYFPDYPKWKE